MLLDMVQQVCYTVLWLQLLFLNEQSAGTAARMQACSTSTSLNTNAVCECKQFNVACDTRTPPLLAVPVQILETSRLIVLSNNKITRIEYDFLGWQKVTDLNLDHNKIYYIQENAFKHMPNLQRLELQNNALERIEEKHFLGMNNILKLYLASNKISYIHPDAFQNMFKLEHLELQDNALERIEEKHFFGLHNILKLILARNKISYIHPDAFRNMFKLEHLELQNNALERIEEKLLFGLNNILEIYLNNNKISYIHPDAFRNMFKLKILNLHHNNLGELDPSGRTFRHLLSLEKLSLQNNSISKVNNYTFVSMFQHAKTVRVNLGENPIHCDCNVWAIKSWTKKYKMLEISNLTCSNGGQKLYQDVQDSEFGDCNSTKKSFGREEIMCPSCLRNRTNNGCSLQEKICSGQNVCQKEITWDASNKTMLITSHCEEYQKCISNEASNLQICDTASLATKNVSYHFCCMGSKCTDHNIGGITKDFTFNLSYNRFGTWNQSNNTLFRDEEERIANGVRSFFRSIQGFEGGIDVYLLDIKPYYQVNPKQYQVVLKLEVTVFNTVKKESVKSLILRALQLSCSRTNSFCHAENIDMNTLNLCSNNEDSEQYQPQNPVLSCEDKYLAFYAKLTSENANNISILLKEYTVKSEDVTVDTINNTLNRLEQYLDETILKQPGSIVSNVLESVNNLINIEQKTLMVLKPETAIIRRLLAIINGISDKAPLKEEGLKVVFPNLAVLAQRVNATETQDVIVTVGGLTDSMVSVSRFEGNHHPSLTGNTSMVFPMRAIAAYLTQKNVNFSRVTFVVHQSAKLFHALDNEGSRGTPQADAEENDFCEKNNSHNCLNRNVNKINSYIISARIPNVTIQNLSENITMNFVHRNINAANPQCVFWKDFLNGTEDWSSVGCGIMNTNSGETTCACNHLTNFALLMDIYQEGSNLSDTDRSYLSGISYVGCGISIFALLLTILTYSVFRRMVQYDKDNPRRKHRGDKPSKILINLCLALMLSNLVFLAGMQKYTSDNTVSCKIVPILLHYLLLSSLTWMAIEAFYMYLAIVRVFKTYYSKFTLKCCLVGWGVPLVIVIITISVNATENYGFISSGLCWLRNPAFYAAFVGPVCFILLVNCIAFGLVVKQLVNISNSKLNKAERYSTIQHLRAAVGVVILLGLTWLFAIFAIGQASVAFYYLFTVFNSLQGLFIFIYYCLLKKDVITIWKSLIPCIEQSEETSKSVSESKALTAVGAAHHQARHDHHLKSESSTSHGNTVSTSVSSE